MRIAFRKRSNTCGAQNVGTPAVIDAVGIRLPPGPGLHGDHPRHNALGDFSRHLADTALVVNAHAVSLADPPLLGIHRVDPQFLDLHFLQPGVGILRGVGAVLSFPGDQLERELFRERIFRAFVCRNVMRQRRDFRVVHVVQTLREDLNFPGRRREGVILRIADVIFEGHIRLAFEEVLTFFPQLSERRQLLIRHGEAGLLPDMFNPLLLGAAFAELRLNPQLSGHFTLPVIVRAAFKLRLDQLFRQDQVACRPPGFPDVPALHKAGFRQQ